MRASTANLAVLGGNVEFSGVPLAGLTTALRGGGVKLLFCQFDKPQHSLFARPEFTSIKALRGKKLAVAGLGTIDDFLLREALNGSGIDPARDVRFFRWARPIPVLPRSSAVLSMRQC